jgi:hypothetical protein
MERKDISRDPFETRHITATAPLPVHRELKAAAARESLSATDLIRKIVLQYLRDDAPRRQRVK